MKQLTLSIFDPNNALYHRAGIAGLALALSAINPNDVPFTWEITEDSVTLSWESTDEDAFTQLMQLTYQIKDGYLNVPALELPEEERYLFTQGIVGTFLQHGKLKGFKKENPKKLVKKEIKFEVDGKEYPIDCPILEKCYYTDGIKSIFTKGTFKPNIPIKSHHLPGAVECEIDKGYEEPFQKYISLLFLPLACNYYKLPKEHKGSFALVIPLVNNLTKWVKRRKNLSESTYRDFYASSASESALRFFLTEKLIEDSQDFHIDYCEVYQLGGQRWCSQQKVKQAVYRVELEKEVLGLYESAYQFFKPQLRTTEKGESFWTKSTVFPWICDNLINGKYWYSGFCKLYKQNRTEIFYETKGILEMINKLTDNEFFYMDVVQKAFKVYASKKVDPELSNKLSAERLRELAQKKTQEIINACTQQRFTSWITRFLSMNASLEIQQQEDSAKSLARWIYENNNWHQIQDLAVIALNFGGIHSTNNRNCNSSCS